MELGPKRPSPLWFLGPNSIIVVYMDALGVVYGCRFRARGAQRNCRLELERVLASPLFAQMDSVRARLVERPTLPTTPIVVP